MSEIAESTTLRQLTLLPADSLASLTVWPGSKEAQRMTATSGRNIAALLPNSDLLGSLLKMSLESEGLFSMMFYLTWKIWRTKSGRLIYRLAESEPGIDDIGFSSLPTPIDPSKGGGSSRSGDRIDETPTLHGMARKGELILWPTPTVHGNYNRKGASKKSGDGLATAVKIWPTPRSSDGMVNKLRAETEIVNHHGRLEDAVAMESPTRGYLNPTWVEWLMGFPMGWTDVTETPPSETL